MADAPRMTETDTPVHVSEALPSWMRTPARLLSEEEMAVHERELRRESRRDRLLNSPIRHELAQDGEMSDEERILNDRMSEDVHAFRVVREWVRRWTGEAASVTRPILIISGPTGSGKTLSAAWAIAEVGGRYVRFPEVIQDHRAFSRKESMVAQERQRDEWRSKYGIRGFVVLDELGIEEEEDRDDARSALNEFFNVRQRWDQRTLVLTNKTNAELLERFQTGQYGVRTRSRINRLLITAERNEDQLSVDLKSGDMRRSSKRGGDR